MQKEIAPLLAVDDLEIMRIARQIRFTYGMKYVLRYATSRDQSVHSESNAEHVFGLMILARFFAEHEVLPRTPDMLRVNDILLYHDFVELKHGDVPRHRKTQDDEERERHAAEEVFGSLPDGMGRYAKQCWEEYERRHTLEAQFAYAIDKVDPVIELLHPVNELSLRRLGFTYEMHTEKKFRATENFPVMRRFVKVLANDFRARGLFVDG